MRVGVLAASVILGLGLLVQRDLHAADGGAGAAAPAATVSPDDLPRRADPVARVGPRTITVGEVEDRVATLSPYQRTTFGADAATIRKRYVLEVMIPESLFALGAADRQLDKKLPTAFDVERVARDAMLREVRRTLGPSSAIPMDEVRKYYEANRDRYDTPERYEILRILCRTRDEAESVLATLKAQLTPQTFSAAARDHSTDKSSYLRSGNLGFVAADGTSNEPGLKVDPAVVQAARSVKDGQLVPAPVSEGTGFAIVWRKATIAANKRSLDDVSAQIRDTMWKERVKETTDRLVAHLRKENLHDLNEGPLGDLPAPSASDAPRAPLR